jgi:hypothetical protein
MACGKIVEKKIFVKNAYNPHKKMPEDAQPLIKEARKSCFPQPYPIGAIIAINLSGSKQDIINFGSTAASGEGPRNLGVKGYFAPLHTQNTGLFPSKTVEP